MIISFIGCNKTTVINSDQSSDGVVTGTVTVSAAAPLSSAGAAGQKVAMSAQATGVVPVPGAVCMIEGTDKKDTTDENGYFEINGVSLGSHILICTKTLADGNSYSFLEVIDVSNGGTTDIGTLELTMGGKIQGTATMEGGTDQSGTKVFIPGTSYQAQTDSIGSYEITNVPAGTYELRFEHSGFKTKTLTDIAVVTGKTTSAINITLTVDTGPTGTILINNGDAYSLARTVTLTITASADASLMMISEDPAFVGAGWQAAAASESYTFDSDGQKMIYIKFSNDNGLESGSVSDDIIVDTAPPSETAIVINDNAASVHTPSVTLTLSAADAATAVSQMMIGNDSGFTGAAWEPFSNTRAWTLSDSDGTKTVYAKFKDTAGNETQAVSASIVLDSSTPAPAGGAIDTGFGTNGKVYLHVGTSSAFLFSVAVQADGKIVAGGYSYVGSCPQFLVVRFNTDGSLDTSFGGTGMVSTSFSNSSGSGIAALAIQPDGKIVAAGNTPSGFGAARYNTDGSLDTSFGTSGQTTMYVGGSYACQALRLQSDGKIVLAGDAGGNMVVVRLSTNGGLDATFNGTGMVNTSFSTGYDEAYALVIQADGKIVVGGHGGDSGQSRNFALLRYNGDGSLDSTFGTDGKVATALGSSKINTLALQADGKIMTGGFLANGDMGGNYWVVAVARYNTDGTLDTSFGANGTITTAAADWRSEAKGIAVLPSGKIIVTGYAGTITNPTDFLLIQYNSDGSPDTFFGTNGVIVTDIAGDADTSNAIAVQSDGKIIAAGSAFFDSATGIALVRYLSAAN